MGFIFISLFLLHPSQKVLAATDTGGNLSVKYQTHIQNIGWQNPVYDGQLSGTTGQSLRLEGINISVDNPIPGMKIKYQTHVQNIGWQNWVYDGQTSGTTGQSLRLEGIKIVLEGVPAGYHVQYQVHVQNIGWQNWVQDGELAGTVGKSLRLEAIKIKLVDLSKPKPIYAIDIGHNVPKYDSGAVGIKTEDACNKEVGTLVIKKLTDLGYTVINCSPINATSLIDSLQQRCDIANAAHADYFMSIHFNIFNGAAQGSEVFMGSDRIKVKATQVLANLASLGFTNRGTYDNSRGLYVLSHTNMPAMLVECAFLDSASDMAKYDADKIADALVNGLLTGN